MKLETIVRTARDSNMHRRCRHFTPVLGTCRRAALLVFMLLAFVAPASAQTQTVQYTYDSLDRLTSVRYADRLVRYTYDAAGNRLSMTVLNPIPPRPTITPSGGTTFCAGGSVTLTSSAGTTYLWSTGATTQAIVVSTTGSFWVRVTDVNGYQSQQSDPVAVIVNPIPSAPTASNSGPYCAGGAISLAVSTVSGASYSWTGPSGYASIVQNPTISNATTAMVGTYSVTVTVNGCTSAAGTTSVAVNPIPGTPTATNNGPLCAGGNLQLSASFVSGATYSWTGPNSFSSTPQNPTIGSVTTAATGTYSVTVTVGGCTSAAGTTAAVINPTPAAPVITVPASTAAGTTGLTASVVSHAGSSWFWTITNGTITAGQGAYQITFTAGTAETPLTLSVTETNALGCVSVAGTATVTVSPADLVNVFFALTPCRVLDTRNPTGPLGAPSLQPGATRTFDPAASPCGIPADAVAISANLTVTNVGAPGELVVFPSDVLRPNTSAISFRAGRTRANNAIVSFSKSGTTFSVFNNSAATVDFILDVNGYFQ
jgi:hypothetical protein